MTLKAFFEKQNKLKVITKSLLCSYKNRNDVGNQSTANFSTFRQ